MIRTIFYLIKVLIIAFGIFLGFYLFTGNDNKPTITNHKPIYPSYDVTHKVKKINKIYTPKISFDDLKSTVYSTKKFNSDDYVWEYLLNDMDFSGTGSGMANFSTCHRANIALFRIYMDQLYELLGKNYADTVMFYLLSEKNKKIYTQYVNDLKKRNYLANLHVLKVFKEFIDMQFITSIDGKAYILSEEPIKFEAIKKAYDNSKTVKFYNKDMSFKYFVDSIHNVMGIDKNVLMDLFGRYPYVTDSLNQNMFVYEVHKTQRSWNYSKIYQISTLKNWRGAFGSYFQKSNLNFKDCKNDDDKKDYVQILDTNIIVWYVFHDRTDLNYGPDYFGKEWGMKLIVILPNTDCAYAFQGYLSSPELHLKLKEIDNKVVKVYANGNNTVKVIIDFDRNDVNFDVKVDAVQQKGDKIFWE